ncbi:MAG: hypothetical protein IT179_04265 [Acidobacteria bacterium]|nr:hypothetical protein [Acidobacteriota bacterium]
MQAQLKDATDVASFAATAVRLGQQHGYRFTAEEVVARHRAPEGDTEVSDQELDAVAGGLLSGLSLADPLRCVTITCQSTIRCPSNQL